MNSNSSRNGLKSVITVAIAALVVLSMATSTAVAAGQTDMTVTADSTTLTPGETTTVTLAIPNANGGVGSADFRVELSDPSVASITDVSLANEPGLSDVAIDGDGAGSNVIYSLANSANDMGPVTIATVTVEAQTTGSTGVNILPNPNTALDVGDEVGQSYTLGSVGSATLTVSEPTDDTAPTISAFDVSASGQDVGVSITTDEQLASIDVSLGGDASGTLSLADFTETDNGDGTYTYTADVSDGADGIFSATLDEAADAAENDGASGQSDSATVATGPANFQVSDLTAPSSATQGDSIQVTATVQNTGDQQGTQTVEFTFDGTVLDDESVTLAAGASQPVSFTVDTTPVAAGTYTHGVSTDDDSTSAQITINEPDAANFQVSNLQAPGSATQGDLIDVSATVENTGGQSATKSVEFRLDVDGDGLGDDDDVVLNQDFQIDAGTSTTVTFDDVDTSGLAGTYTHGVVTPDDSATAQITIEDQTTPPSTETTVSLLPADQTGAVGATTTYEIVVDNVDGGVGAAELRVSVDDTSIATITGASVLDAGAAAETDVTNDGSFVDIDYAFADTTDTGSVTVATVSVEGTSEGTASLSLGAAAGNNGILVFDEGGNSYDEVSTNGATLDVLPTQFLVDSTSAPEKAAVGETVTVTATISSDGEVESTQPVELLFDVDGDGTPESVSTEQVTISASGQTQVTFDVSVPADTSFGDRTYTVETTADSASGTVEITPPDVNGDGNLPGDIDGDGLYEDVNGDGLVDTGDAQSLFSNRDADVIQNNIAAFDFNGDGVVNVGDAQMLFNMATGS